MGDETRCTCGHLWLAHDDDACRPDHEKCSCKGRTLAPSPTDLPDAETAWAEWSQQQQAEGYSIDCEAGFFAGFAAASGPWAEQLDTANAEQTSLNQPTVLPNYEWRWRKSEEHKRELREKLKAALARNAELEAKRDEATHHAIECEAKMDAACSELARYGEPLNEVYETDGIIIVRQNLHDLRAQNSALRAELDNLRKKLEAQDDTDK